MKTENSSTFDPGWDLIDRLASKESETPTPVELVFDGKKVTGNWYHPKMAPIVCRVCGKRCREKGLSPCTNVNPLCG